MLAPRTKTEFYRHWPNGRYGNINLMWPTLEAFLASGYTGLVAIRTKGVGTRCDYDIPPDDLRDRWEEFLAEGWRPSELNISAMMRDSDILIQGNVVRSYFGLQFDYTTVKKPMRIAFKEESLEARGIKAYCLLKGAMDAGSFDWLMELLDTYDSVNGQEYSAVVELSAYRVPVGVLHGYNTIFWEVRAY